MIFDKIIRKPNYIELDRAYKQLSNMYQDLFEEKQSEVDLRDQKIEQLSKKVRQWMRKYHQLEVSTREDSIDVSSEVEDQDYVQSLQDIVSELSKKNAQLEERLKAQKIATTNLANQTLAARSKVGKPVNAKNQDSEKCEVIDISDSNQTGIRETKASKVSEKPEQTNDDQEIELRFSPKFQALLEKHANESNA